MHIFTCQDDSKESYKEKELIYMNNLLAGKGWCRKILILLDF